MKSKTSTKKALTQREKLIERYMDLRANEADLRGRINDLKHFLKINIMESKDCMRQIEELDNLFCAETQNQKETKT